MENIVKIGIWSEKYQNDLKSYLLRYSVQMDTEFCIFKLSTNEELIDALVQNQIELLFLDIDQSSSYHIAEALKKNGCLGETEIILISEGDQCSAAFIKLHPVDYLCVPMKYRTLQHCLNSLVKTQLQENKMFIYSSNRNKGMIRVSTVLYLQSVGKQMVIHTNNGEQIVFYGKMSECMQENCFSDFLELHQSFAVNVRYVERFERNQVLVRGVWLPVSRSRTTLVKERLKELYC